MTNGQVRNALTSVMKRMFSVEGNFNKAGYLQLGFAGHQPELADYYTNNGSLYLTSLVFLPLGLAPPIMISGLRLLRNGLLKKHGVENHS